MERLSSGLRINSAKDDAAGLAISDRMTSQIRGLNQAARNANDGISLAQTAEGAMQETVNILQRIRELAVQSANDTNSDADRASLQAEVDQLVQELNRISDSTQFNGLSILDGTFVNKSFQVGANANETVGFSLGSTHSKNIGSYVLETLNALQQNGTGSVHQPTNLLPISDTPTTLNSIGNQILTINGISVAEVNIRAGDSAQIVANKINAISSVTGVQATGATHMQLSNLSADGNISFTLETDFGHSVTVNTSVTINNMDSIAAIINADTATHGFTAEPHGNYIYIIRYSDGYDSYVKDFTHSNGSGESIRVNGYDGGNAVLISGNEDSTIVNGVLDIFSYTNTFTVSSSISYNNGGSVLDAPANTILNSFPAIPWGFPNYVGIQGNPDPSYYTGISIPPTSTIWSNNILEQLVTIDGGIGDAIITIEDGDSAQQIAYKVNSVYSETGVKAEAITEVSLSNISNDGLVTLTLGTDEGNFIVQANVTSGSLEQLSQEINRLGSNNQVSSKVLNDFLVISQSEGKDIRIENFIHEIPGSTIDVTGMNGQSVQLMDGDNDSTVATGSVKMSSCSKFGVSSNLNGADGSIVNQLAGNQEISELSKVSEIDISTFEGAQNAIQVSSDAICQIDRQRSNLGAIQNRFESTIANLQNIAENLTAARSRIIDADIAKESSEMTKQNILQQAGTAILSQANQQPQLALSLLQNIKA